jgi:uncharacterized protein YggT (Ycf19 family)
MANSNSIQVPGYLKVSKVLAWVMYAWVIFGIIVLSLRVFLLAFSANRGAGFVDFIYRTSADYLQPFRGIFPTKNVGETGYLDISALFAIIIYALVGWGFAALISYIQHKIDTFESQLREELAAQNARPARTTTRKAKR